MRPSTAGSLFVVIALCCAAQPGQAARESRPSATELVSLRAASALALSPDGGRVAFLLASATFDSTAQPKEGDDGAGWKRERQVWVVDAASHEARALTHGDAAASGPCWSPDGRTLAFVREAGGKAVLQLLPLSGGEAAKLATGALEPSEPAFSPDGRFIAFLADAPPDAKERRARRARGGAIHWEHEFAPARLWIVPVAGGEPRLVPAGPNVVSFAWSPDGRSFAVLTSESSDPYLVSSLNRLAIVDASGARPARPVPRAPSFHTRPAWSPDGRWVATLSLNGGLSNPNALLVCDAASGAVRDLAPDADRTFMGFAWAADSKSLVAVVSARTATVFERFPLAGAPRALPTPARTVTSALVANPAGTRLAFLSATDRTPEEVTVCDPDGGEVSVLTALNPQVAAWRVGDTRLVRWRNAEGIAIEGVLTTPAGMKPGLPAPLVVLPHGGPDEVTTTRFSPLVQYFASRGYSTLRPNYRGSFGYGFAFYAANRNRFGEVEQADIESGVDELIRERLADPKRLYFGGWSWGGYITTWTIGHVQRYRAAVAGAAVSDVFHSYSLSDINHGVAARWEFEGDPWRQPEHFDRVNPIRFVTNVRTPLLLLHGQADRRVPFAESVQFYRALADLGREVEFWAYPREDHGFVEPAHRADYIRRWADWYDAH
ncbi:MAG: S9 family peptidase [Candidatus Eisenbacteria bacterium]|nr:S9 family peptidase [Candidatus Eisenbacteria bacterium]